MVVVNAIERLAHAFREASEASAKLAQEMKARHLPAATAAASAESAAYRVAACEVRALAAKLRDPDSSGGALAASPTPP